MKTMESSRRHPVAVYFCATIAVSWVGSVLAAGSTFLLGESLELEQVLIVGVLVIAGPFLAGITMTYVVNGSPGLGELLSRLVRWQVGGRWYAALLIFPLVLLALSLVLGAWFSPGLSPIFFTPGIMMGLLAGSIEEVGWTGFAYPMMRSKWTVLQTTIALGMLHALWHIVPDILANYHSLGSYWLPYFASFSVSVIALRVLIVWVYVNTGSLLLAQLMHASSTGFLAVLIPTNIAPTDWAVFYCIYALALSLVAGVVVTGFGRGLTLQRGR